MIHRAGTVISEIKQNGLSKRLIPNFRKFSENGGPAKSVSAQTPHKQKNSQASQVLFRDGWLAGRRPAGRSKKTYYHPIQ